MIEKAKQKEISVELNMLSKAVVDAAFKVHLQLGSGLLEKVYELALMEEILVKGLNTERQVSFPVYYNGKCLDEAGYRMDLLIEKILVVEIKSVEHILPIHRAQLLTYLKLSGKRLGLLINFNVELIKNGIRRVIL
ncbi:GxxExxY protein [bacterium]|nr:GxxExxY protein [bacterium]